MVIVKWHWILFIISKKIQGFPTMTASHLIPNTCFASRIRLGTPIAKVKTEIVWVYKPNTAGNHRCRISDSWNTGHINLEKESNQKSKFFTAFCSGISYERNFCDIAFLASSLEPYTYWTHFFHSLKTNDCLCSDCSQHSCYWPFLLRMALPIYIVYGSAHTSTKGA